MRHVRARRCVRPLTRVPRLGRRRAQTHRRRHRPRRHRDVLGPDQLPPPHRASAEIVGRFIDHHVTVDVPRLPGPGSAVVLEAARAGGITGGAVYDLLVGLSAAHADATLLSLDRRAARTYDTAGVRFELLRPAD